MTELPQKPNRAAGSTRPPASGAVKPAPSWRRPALLGTALLSLSVMMGASWVYFNPGLLHKPVAPKPVPTPLVLKAPFGRLREVGVLGSRLVVYRYLPTGQRVVVLAPPKHGEQGLDPEAFFGQKPAPWQWALFLRLFQAKTVYGNQPIAVDAVTVTNKPAETSGPIRMQLKRYHIVAHQGRKPLAFDVDAGLLRRIPASQATGLVMTFGMAGAISDRPMKAVILQAAEGAASASANRLTPP